MQNKTKNLADSNLKTELKLPYGFHIEVDRVGNGLSASIMGVVSIIDFSETVAILKMRRGKIKVSGSELSVAVYENKTVEILGRICAVEFL